jgi:CubicO group peptidase (beta-lactamase class C family)
MLLSHVASIQDDPVEMRACTTRGDPTVPLGDFLRRCMTAPDAGAHFLGVAPAKVHRYSNLGASLAAMVVETKSGESFDAYSRAHVLEPLGITDARWKMADLDASRVAIPHRWTGRAYEATGHVGHMVYPVVDLRATAEDVATLLGAFAEGGALGAARILRRETLADMLRPHYPALDPNQGLAFQRIEIDGRTLWGHEGEDEGATTMAFFDPETRAGAAILANGDAFISGSALRAAAMKDLLREALK